MLKSLVYILLIALAALPVSAQTDKQGYSPWVNSYGNGFHQLRTDSAQHIPHKYALALNTNDTTPQLFAWSTPSGDSLILFVNGRYIVIGSQDGAGLDSTFSGGTFISKTSRGDTIAFDLDTGAAHTYFVIFADIDSVEASLRTLINTKLSSISTTNSVAGAGTTPSPVQLVGDALNPGNSYYYGTNSSGAKGWNPLPSGVAGASPTASIGLTPVNGSASTFMRSDAAPALATQPAGTVIGNGTGSPATPSYLTTAQVITMLSAITDVSGSVQFVEKGLYSAHPTTGKGFYFANDSTQTGGWFYDSLGHMNNITPQITLSVRGKGQPGDTTMITLSGSIVTGFNLNVAAIRDSSAGIFAHTINADGSWTLSAIISATNSITGAGTAASPLKLQGDAASPGNSQYYGTNSSGTKGWNPLPSGGGSVTLIQLSDSLAVARAQSQYVFDITKFGASKASSDNGPAYRAAIAAAIDSGGGKIYTPPGKWFVNTKVNFPVNVALEGDGQAADTVYMTGSDTLFTCQNSNYQTAGYAHISGMTFQGNGTTAKCGLGLYGLYQFHITDVATINFTGPGMYMKACQQGLVKNGYFSHNGAYGVYLDTGYVGVFSNQVYFVSCHFWYDGTWGYCNKTLQYDADLVNCDFIMNGVSGNLNTGSTFVGPSSWSGAAFDHCEWEEQQPGTTCVYLSGCSGGQTNTTHHYLRNCKLFGSSHAIGVYVTAPTNTTILEIEGGIYGSDSVDLAIGAGTVAVTKVASPNIVTTNQTTNANFYIKDLSSAGSGIQSLSTINARASVTTTLKNGAGTGATCTFASQSTNISGTFTYTPGTSATASDTVALIQFLFPNSLTTSFTAGGVVTFTPINTAAKNLGGDAAIILSDALVAQRGFYILSPAVLPTPGTPLVYSYIFSGY